QIPVFLRRSDNSRSGADGSVSSGSWRRLARSCCCPHLDTSPGSNTSSSLDQVEPDSNCAFTSPFNTFPTLDRGRSAHTRTSLGALTLPSNPFANSRSSEAETSRPAWNCTTAVTCSPHFECGNPTTAQSSTAG